MQPVSEDGAHDGRALMLVLHKNHESKVSVPWMAQCMHGTSQSDGRTTNLGFRLGQAGRGLAERRQRRQAWHLLCEKWGPEAGRTRTAPCHRTCHACATTNEDAARWWCLTMTSPARRTSTEDTHARGVGEVELHGSGLWALFCGERRARQVSGESRALEGLEIPAAESWLVLVPRDEIGTREEMRVPLVASWSRSRPSVRRRRRHRRADQEDKPPVARGAECVWIRWREGGGRTG